jgi:hypothetical protein
MDLVLVSITAISLVLAIAMGLIVFKLLRDERRRSEARVALLAAAAADEPSFTLHEPDAVSPAAPQEAIAGDLFVVQETESPWKRRLGVAAALALVVTSAGYGLSRWGSTEPEQGIVSVAPLELVALQHSQEPDALTIAGTVSNPRGGATASQVTATAFLFASDGTVLASGRAPLDYAVLAAGDESGFVIKVPVTGTVSRYRVGFRGPDGSVIAHVDRRADGSSALNTGRTGNAPWVR